MKKELIVDLIEKLINNEPCDLKLLANASPKTSVEEFLLNQLLMAMHPSLLLKPVKQIVAGLCFGRELRIVD